MYEMKLYEIKLKDSTYVTKNLHKTSRIKNFYFSTCLLKLDQFMRIAFNKIHV